MYNDERPRGINFISIIVKVIFVILFMLVLVWLFPKVPKMDAFYSNVFRENLKYMQEAGKSYFTTDKLPTELGKTEKITLEEMFEKNLILSFVDKDGKACNLTESYVSVTKEEDYYVLKAYLNCDSESDFVNEIIGCYSYCEDDNCNKKCSVSKIVEYQFRKATSKNTTSYSCDKGYTLKGKYCYKNVLKNSKDAEVKTTTTKTTITPAVVTIGESKTVYEPYIVTDGEKVKTCPSGTYLSKDVCVSTKTPTPVSTCPSGAYLAGGKCIVSQAPTDVYSCPSGTYLAGGKCIYTQSPTTSCSCPSGSTVSGNNCIYSQPAMVSTSCPSGYYDNGSNCYSNKVIPGSTYTVPATQSCSVKTYCTQQYGSNYEFIGTTTSDSCTIAYKYKVCSYNCTNGTISGTNCVVTTGSRTEKVYANKITNYTCPTGWTLNGTTCKYTQTATNCKVCPTGWSIDTAKNLCWKGETAPSKQGCPEGYYYDSAKNMCWTQKEPTVKQGCPVGWYIDKTKNVCWKSEPAGTSTGKVYSCREGWTKTGSGTNTICSKVIPGEKKYSCADKDAKLNNNDKKCYKTITGTFTELKCDKGYKLEGKTCKLYETSKVKAKASASTKKTYEYKWSAETNITGWEKTGKTRTIDGPTVCE